MMHVVPRFESGGGRWRGPVLGALLGLLLGPFLAPHAGGGGVAHGQAGADRDAYVRLMSIHFELPSGEAERLLEGRLAADELPVVLFLARESGIAAPALVAMRRAGSAWSALGRRAGVGGDRFHVEIPDAAVDARVVRIQERFSATPRSGWAALDFTDDEVITLVHLQVLTRQFNVPVEQVLRARADAATWIEVPARLARQAQRARRAPDVRRAGVR
jgi:hypothetical protein